MADPAPEKLNVPAELYDEALDFVNARRAEKGLEPRTELPPGLSSEFESCPCAADCGAPIWVSHYGWKWKTTRGLGARNQATPEVPDRFTKFFDAHAHRGVLTLPVRA